MRPSLKDQGVPDESEKKIVVSLAGMDGEASSSCEKAIGPSFMPSTDIQILGISVWFGLDDDRMAKEAVVTMDRTCIPLGDDISVVTVHIA